MRTGSRRNKRPFWYAKQTGEIETIYDENLDEAGRSALYGPVVKAWGNVSAGGGELSSSRFGILPDYNKVINPMPLDFPMDETDYVWYEREPVLDENNRTETPPNYTVRHVSTTENYKNYALMQIGGGFE